MNQKKAKEGRREIYIQGYCKGWLACIDTINAYSFFKRFKLCWAILHKSLSKWLLDEK